MLVFLWNRPHARPLLGGVLRQARYLSGGLIESLLQLHVLLCRLKLLEHEALQVFHAVCNLGQVVCRPLVKQMALLLVFQGLLRDE